MVNLVGRETELQDAWRLLAEGSRTVCVTGDPGAGKSALLGAVEELATAEGWQVIALRGRPSEHALPFAGIVDLLSGRGLTLAPTSRSRAAQLIERLTGPVDDGSIGALVLRLDLLHWLTEVAAAQPLLLVVDDQQWVDDSSWSVLSFVANRIADTSVACLVAARSTAVVTGLETVPTLTLSPLDFDQACAVLDSLGVSLNPVVRAAVLDLAAGNPLALREFARAARLPSPATPTGSQPTIPKSLEAAFAAELPMLPAGTRSTLLLAAAGGNDVGVLGRVVAPHEVAADLAPAETVGLVSVVEGRVRFRHPLARSTVYNVASSAERLAAHQRLAEAYPDDPVRRTWQRAAATVGPDESMAVELVAASAGAAAQGAYAEAARAMVRAAELSVRRTDREARMLDAMELVSATGNFARLLAMSEQLRAESPDPVVRARATQQVAYVMAQSMRQSAALDALEGSLAELLAADVDWGWASLTTLASLGYQTGRGADRVRHWYDRYVREAPPTPEPFAAITRAARGWIEVALAPMSRPAELVALVREAPPLDLEVPPDVVASHEMLLGATAWLLDETEVAGRRLHKAADMMRRGIAADQMIQTLMALGHVQFDTGAFSAAADTARSMIDLSEANNLVFYRLVGRELLARTAAIISDPDSARLQAEGVLQRLEIGECASLEANLRLTLARAAFAAGDLQTSYRHVRSLFDRDGAPMHTHVCYHVLGDLASVAVAAGERDEAVAIVDRARSHLDGTRNERLTVILQRALGLLADGEEAEAYFELATTNPDARRWPFEWAQAQLAYGSWLRRRRRPTPARDQLAAARDTFARIGAQAWAQVAESELRAAGVTSGVTGSTWAQMTAQERQIVQFAAAGMTNREIGQRLFLSPRTVSTHLYHAFPKLGVTSRAQLRDALDRLNRLDR